MLIDQFDREIDYLRISVTDRCNLHCIYCVGRKISFYPRQEILTYEEIFEIIKIAQELGIKKFRITGGEPLLRSGLLNFLKKLANAKINYSLTTNGLLLKKYAKDLRQVGLESINISLDTLEKNKFAKITGEDILPEIFRGIDEVEKVGFSPIKINVVVMNGINENEIENFITFFGQRKNFLIRFIEYMPFERSASDYFFPLSGIEEKIKINPQTFTKTKIEGAGPARYYQIGQTLVGFITPRSQPFCHYCNRLRLTSDGKLKPCLVSPISYDLKEILRASSAMPPRQVAEEETGYRRGDRSSANQESNKSISQEIKRIFKQAVQTKPEGHNFHFLGEMIKIGG